MADELADLCYGGEMILPDRDSYQLGMAYGAVGTDIGGGPRRQRAQYRNNSVNVTVNYTMDACQTQWFMDFYYATLAEGQLPVNVRLDLTGSDLIDETIYVATITQAPFPSRYDAILNTVSVTYNAVPKIDRCTSLSRVDVYQAFGRDTGWVINNIDSLLENLGRITL